MTWGEAGSRWRAEGFGQPRDDELFGSRWSDYHFQSQGQIDFPCLSMQSKSSAGTEQTIPSEGWEGGIYIKVRVWREAGGKGKDTACVCFMFVFVFVSRTY